MRILLSTYNTINLGDDLFIKVFLERYQGEHITLPISDKIYTKMFKAHFIKHVGYKNIIARKITNNQQSYLHMVAHRYDLFVRMGGSVFIEHDHMLSDEIEAYKRYCIIGSNFGPYKTKQFLAEKRNIIAKAEDVCFREQASYDMFKDLPNVRVAPDIIYALDTKNIHSHDARRVVISVIDCNTKCPQVDREKYEQKILELTQYFQAKNYWVCLMSFCQQEGDEDAIDRIFAKIEDKTRIEKYFYRGKIDEALDNLANSQIIVGSRFHANILGLILNKTVIPIAYSDKTLNSLADINFKGKIYDLRKLDQIQPKKLTDKDLSYTINVDKERKAAVDHFKIIDKIIKESHAKN